MPLMIMAIGQATSVACIQNEGATFVDAGVLALHGVTGIFAADACRLQLAAAQMLETSAEAFLVPKSVWNLARPTDFTQIVCFVT